jgi:hypothetical protein
VNMVDPSLEEAVSAWVRSSETVSVDLWDTTLEDQTRIISVVTFAARQMQLV